MGYRYNLLDTVDHQLTTSSNFPSMAGGSPFGFSASFGGSASFLSASFLASLPAGGFSAFFLASSSI